MADTGSILVTGAAGQLGAVGRTVTGLLLDRGYSDLPPEDWERELKRAGLPEHLTRHLMTMAELNRAGRYDRLARAWSGSRAGRRWASGNLCRFTPTSLAVVDLKRFATPTNTLQPTWVALVEPVMRIA